MTKDKKGITLVSLVITIIVMLILLGITLISGTTLLDNSRLTKLEVQLYLVKARAETLVEQYNFDENLKSLLSFSQLEQKNYSPIAYNAGTIELSYINSEGNSFNASSTDKDFKNAILRIYGFNIDSQESVKNSAYGSSKTLDEESKTVGKYLFVKWGLQECVSQGVIKLENDQNPGNKKKSEKNAIIDDETKFAIVVYNLEDGTVDNVAYSLGYRNSNGVVKYTLEDMMTDDVDEDD